jgi:hypothetical protein
MLGHAFVGACGIISLNGINQLISVNGDAFSLQCRLNSYVFQMSFGLKGKPKLI